GVEPYIDMLKESAAELEAIEKDADAAAKREAHKLRLTDAGNAARLIRRHGGDLRWSVADKAWIFWTGQRWAVDDIGEVERRCLDTVKSIYEDALRAKDDNLRKALMRFALECEESYRLSAMKRGAWYQPGVPVKADELDADPWLLNCRNGTLNLKTG